MTETKNENEPEPTRYADVDGAQDDRLFVDSTQPESPPAADGKSDEGTTYVEGSNEGKPAELPTETSAEELEARQRKLLEPVEMTPPEPPVVTHAELPIEALGKPAEPFVEMPEGHETLPTVDWLRVEEARDPKYSWRTGGNGLFKATLRWSDYISKWPVEARPDFEAIRASIIAKRVWVGAEEHVSDAGAWIPVVSGSRAYRFGAEGWGDLMCAIWSSELNKDLSPTDFYHWRTAEPPEHWGNLSERSASNKGPQQFEEGHELKEPGEDAPLHGRERHHAGLVESSMDARETVAADEETTEARAELNAEEKAEPGEHIQDALEAEGDAVEGDDHPEGDEQTTSEETPKKKKKKKTLW